MIIVNDNTTELFHLVYVSRTTEAFLKQDIEQIKFVSQQNNLQFDVTGILVFGNERFMQFLEGSEINVIRIFSKIKKDPRHHKIDVIRRGSIPRRQFSDWNMRLTYPNEINIRSGVIYNKLFDAKIKTETVIDYAIESRALLLAFKKMC